MLNCVIIESSTLYYNYCIGGRSAKYDFGCVFAGRVDDLPAPLDAQLWPRHILISLGNAVWKATGVMISESRAEEGSWVYIRASREPCSRTTKWHALIRSEQTRVLDGLRSGDVRIAYEGLWLATGHVSMFRF